MFIVCWCSHNKHLFLKICVGGLILEAISQNTTMAANSGVSTSKSAKLMHKMNPYGYKKFCSYISERDSISLEFWKAFKWVNYFALDISLMFKNGKVNPDHVYKLFGNFNGLSAQEVRMHLLEYIYENIDFFECRSSVCLALHGIGMNTWVDMVEDSHSCDELALLGLSAMYQRHSGNKEQDLVHNPN